MHGGVRGRELITPSYSICLKKGGELIINYQLEYYEKNLISYLFVYN